MKRAIAFAWFALGGVGIACADHIRVIEGPVLAPEEGLLLGNGDLSVSIYQDANAVIFRFGKGDVWDRRVFTNDCMRPASIKEFRDGVLKEGWQASGGNGPTTKSQATKGAKDEKRMQELLGGSSRTPIRSAAFPCPKPVGELRMRLPTDLAGYMKTTQRLFIEEGRLEITLDWPGGVTIVTEAVVDPGSNVFSLAWKVSGWNDHTYVGREKRIPVWFQLWRWKDPDFLEWSSRYNIIGRHGGFLRSAKALPVEPLPPPKVRVDGRAGVIEQIFYPDLTFPDGFRYTMTLDSAQEGLGRCTIPEGVLPEDDAWLEYLALGQLVEDGAAGELAVTVKTSRDASLVAGTPKAHAVYVATAKAAASAYWKSRVTFPQDRFLEDLWFATYHARRCVLKGGTVPPGLFLPSTVNDFSHWHGDYHANYNMESIYWGDLTANHLEQTEAYFDCCDFFADIGRKIAKDYYDGRGVFIQLEGYPMKLADDIAGRIPLGRMAYMTGWFMTRYWEYYQYTRDRDWLAKRGYPFIRDCALFYLDFLQKAPSDGLPEQLKDGKYHAFPSICGEADMRDPMKLCDGWQVMIHCRHSLYAAIEASKVLGVDEGLRRDWQDRLDSLPSDYARHPRATDYEWHCTLVNSPEHRRWASPYAANTNVWDGILKPRGRSNGETWYEGLQTIWKIGVPRSNSCIAGKTYAEFRRALAQWVHPNGLVWAMAIQNYGRAGAWTETLSVMAPFQEMLLQSWDGAINVFPRWPKDKDASFDGWRAQGAFIVGAAQKDGRVVNFQVHSEKGEDCLVHGDWKVYDDAGDPVPADRDEFGRLRFKTTAGAMYSLKHR
ncbi:MAG: hypothetical protein PUJ80_04930 [Verrucomicrobiota bacterium]|nr:hypothetical protein [Verrucomicrobiota bacterium]